MEENNSIIEDSLNFAWHKTWSNILPLLGYMGIPIIAAQVISIALDFLLKGAYPAMFLPLKMLIMLPINLIVHMGLINIALKVVNEEKIELQDFFRTKGNLWQFFVGSFAYGVTIFVGALLLIFPAFIWGVKYGMFDIRIVDRGTTGTEGIGDSAKLTAGLKMSLFLLYLLLLAIQFAGLLCLVVGLIPAEIISFLARVYAYKQCLRAHPELEA